MNYNQALSYLMYLKSRTLSGHNMSICVNGERRLNIFFHKSMTEENCIKWMRNLIDNIYHDRSLEIDLSFKRLKKGNRIKPFPKKRLTHV